VSPTWWPPSKYKWRPLLKMTRIESSVIPFLVPRHKVWLTYSARVPCSNAANIGERKTWTQNEFCTWQNSVRGQQPPKMYTMYQPRRHQTSCKVWLTFVEWRRCSNEGKTRNSLKFAGVPQTGNWSQPLVSRSSPYCEACGGDIAV